MRRPLLSKLSPSWQKASVLFFAFAMGVVVDRIVILVSPMVYRVVNVTTIHGTKDKGCEGFAGSYSSLFGRPMGQSDGSFRSACGERVELSEREALLCRCD